MLQDVELPQIVRVKFELDGKPIEKTPHAEYGVLDVVWAKHWKKAIADVRSITQHTTRVYNCLCTHAHAPVVELTLSCRSLS